jgi:hypothetical protein
VTSLWLDVFQKIKALGYNAVSFYVDWALVEGKQGDFTAEGVFAWEPFFEAAQKAGIYLIAVSLPTHHPPRFTDQYSDLDLTSTPKYLAVASLDGLRETLVSLAQEIHVSSMQPTTIPAILARLLQRLRSRREDPSSSISPRTSTVRLFPVILNFPIRQVCHIPTSLLLFHIAAYQDYDMLSDTSTLANVS